jgi:hypothetical protein
LFNMRPFQICRWFFSMAGHVVTCLSLQITIGQFGILIKVTIQKKSPPVSSIGSSTDS